MVQNYIFDDDTQHVREPNEPRALATDQRATSRSATRLVLILAYGRESWVMAERVRSQVQASEMKFLRRIEGVTLFDKL